MVVKTTEGTTEKYDITHGVVESEMLCPRLYDLFTSELEDLLIKKVKHFEDFSLTLKGNLKRISKR